MSPEIGNIAGGGEAMRLGTKVLSALVSSVALAQSVTPIRPVEQGSADERIRVFQAKLAQTPGEMRAQAGLAAAYLQKLRETSDTAYFERARKLADQLLAKNPGELVALRLQNEIELLLHNFRSVAERADSMTRFAPSDAASWGNLGDAAMELGQYERAGAAYRRMFALRPNMQSYSRLAYFQFVTGHGEAAITTMQNAVEAGGAADESVAWCLAELGDFLYKLGRLDEAATSYTSSLELFGKMHRAHAGLGRIAKAKNNAGRAIAEYEQAQAVVPLVEYASALEDLYRSAGNEGKAQRQSQLIDVTVKLGKAASEKTNRNLALALADHNRDIPLALALMEAELPDRGDVYTWDAYAWVLFKAGRISDAKAASDKALSQHTPEPLFQQHAREISAVQTGAMR